jgi:AMMECR1 domain-containing protein
MQIDGCGMKGGVLRRGWLVILSFFLVVGSGTAWAESVPLTEVVRQTMAVYFEQSTPKPGEKPYAALARRLSASDANRKPAGVFVTLSRAGKPRACWGSVYPQHKNALESTIYATLGALTKEYRYKPISRSEWQMLKPQVTVVRELEAIESLRGINPLRDGLMVRAGGRSGVILPGEARDATYQLVQARLKAGIRPGEKYQLYRIVADVYQ